MHYQSIWLRTTLLRAISDGPSDIDGGAQTVPCRPFRHGRGATGWRSAGPAGGVRRRGPGRGHRGRQGRSRHRGGGRAPGRRRTWAWAWGRTSGRNRLPGPGRSRSPRRGAGGDRGTGRHGWGADARARRWRLPPSGTDRRAGEPTTHGRGGGGVRRAGRFGGSTDVSSSRLTPERCTGCARDRAGLSHHAGPCGATTHGVALPGPRGPDVTLGPPAVHRGPRARRSPVQVTGRRFRAIASGHSAAHRITATTACRCGPSAAPEARRPRRRPGSTVPTRERRARKRQFRAAWCSCDPPRRSAGHSSRRAADSRPPVRRRAHSTPNGPPGGGTSRSRQSARAAWTGTRTVWSRAAKPEKCAAGRQAHAPSESAPAGRRGARSLQDPRSSGRAVGNTALPTWVVTTGASWAASVRESASQAAPVSRPNSGTDRTTRPAAGDVSIPPITGSAPPAAVQRRPGRQLKHVLQREATHGGTHLLDGRLFVRRRLGHQKRPVQHHDPLPDLGGQRGCQVVALAHREVPQSARGVLRLADVAEPRSGREHSVEHGSPSGRADAARLGQQGPHPVCEPVALLLPPRKPRGIAHQRCQRRSPGGRGVLVRSVVHRPSLHVDGASQQREPRPDREVGPPLRPCPTRCARGGRGSGGSGPVEAARTVRQRKTPPTCACARWEGFASRCGGARIRTWEG